MGSLKPITLFTTWLSITSRKPKLYSLFHAIDWFNHIEINSQYCSNKLIQMCDLGRNIYDEFGLPSKLIYFDTTLLAVLLLIEESLSETELMYLINIWLKYTYDQKTHNSLSQDTSSIQSILLRFELLKNLLATKFRIPKTTIKRILDYLTIRQMCDDLLDINSDKSTKRANYAISKGIDNTHNKIMNLIKENTRIGIDTDCLFTYHLR